MEITAIDKKIQKWLLDEGFKISTLDDKNAFFNYLVEDKRSRTVNIYQNKNRMDRITIATRVVLTIEQKEALIKLGSKKMTRLFWEIRLGLIKMNVGFDSINEILNEGIKFTTNIYYDGLTKDSFMIRMFDVRKALLYFRWMFDREFGEIEPTSDPSFII